MKYLVIDGSNLVRKIYGFSPVEARKERYRGDTANSSAFVSVLKRFIKRCPKFTKFNSRLNSAVEVHFDGKPRDIFEAGVGKLTCICSGYSSSDDMIIRRISALPSRDRRQVLLLTFDRELAANARKLSAHVINPDSLIEMVERHGLSLHSFA
ncbi:MAG: hypothetical protein FD189_1300 [Elusimicrobia bacterium]|nr:MAG: hypothetical protein FD154_1524 [Elusimicrobiota bacterium]KAF0155707.1 MAG: hypothetical protein FD189_1300 [Elusimicrobiota bacterium]